LYHAADELERQADELRAKAKTLAGALKSREAAKLTEQHGPIHPFIETAEFNLAAEMFNELAALPEQEAIEQLLDLDLVPTNRGYWGDIQYLVNFAPLEPAVSWTNVGNEHGLPPEVVASIIPSPP
jgi:hypothetical protein